MDRRAARTQARLRSALGALIREKAYDRIAIKEILARADVGRSTFYAHFPGKDALLRNCIDDLLAGPPRPAERHPTRGRHTPLTAFALPLLEHIAEHRNDVMAANPLGGHRAMHDQLREVVAAKAEDEVRRALRRTGRMGPDASPELIAAWISATFVLVLDWWITAEAAPPSVADARFRALVEPALAPLMS